MMGRLRLAFRQWQRTLLGTVLLVGFMLTYIAVGLTTENQELLYHPIGWLALFLACAIVAICLTLIGALLVPGLLPLIELWGISLIVGTALLSFLKISEWMPEWSGIANCALLMTVFLLVHKFLYGDWQANALATKPATTKRSIKLSSDPETVWKALRPDPKRAGDHYWTGTTFLPAPDATDADFIMNRPRRGGLKDENLLVSVQDEEPLRSFALVNRPANANDIETPSSRLSFTLEPRPGGGTHLSVEETMLRYTPGQRLAWWLANDLSDHLHSMRAKIDGKSDGSIHGSQMIPKRRIQSQLAGPT